MSHTIELVERHRITLPVGATADNVAVARLHAEAWARAQGLELRAGSFNVIRTMNTWPSAERAGVAFDVTVGRGDVTPSDQSEAWTWSGRMEHWRELLTPPRGTAKLIPIRRDTARERLGVPEDGASGIRIERGGLRFPAPPEDSAPCPD